MYPHLLKLQIAMMSLVAIGGFVLGSNIGDPNIVRISLLGAVVAFVLVDRLKWFDLSGWLANITFLLILIYSMRAFIGGNSTDKLVAVANLLAYLQVALTFQPKTPRLGWQLMILSILQIVVAAIFNLNFEYGIYFAIYFAVVTITMTLQNDFAKWTRTNRQNTKNISLAGEQAKVSSVAHPGALGNAVALSRLPGSSRLFSAWMLVMPWLMVSLAFSFLLFHSLPRTQQDTDNPAVKKFIGTGQSRSVDLDFDGVVPLSNAIIFRAKFLDVDTNEDILLKGETYFRGMAYSKLVYDNSTTSWEAPYDHVFNWSYIQLPRFRRLPEHAGVVRNVGLEITLEPNVDPLLYATMPAIKLGNGDSEIEFCRDLSALTRRRSKSANTITSYQYEVGTLLDAANRTLPGTPYVPFKFGNSFPFMETGSPEHQLLTEIDRSKYPELIKISDQLASEVDKQDRIKLCNTLLGHFSPGNRYDYTIDYRQVTKDKSLDPVEDFVRNHRNGHCQLYASALTLMLRSQGIPARYVIGFHGGEYNTLASCYMVHGRHAHAWVEAYIPPEMCTERMFSQQIAGKGGAWITLDPTPPVDFGGANEALDLARSIWQDYVISPDHNKQEFTESQNLLLASARDTDLERIYYLIVDNIKNSFLIQISLVLFAVAFLLLLAVRGRSRSSKSLETKQFVKQVRNFLANAASVVSPQLAQFIGGRTGNAVPFYVKFENLLAKHFQLERSPEQTQLEFADAAVVAIKRDIAKKGNLVDRAHADNPATQDPDAANQLQSLLQSVTHAFYAERFGPNPLDKEAVADIENQIENLEKIISGR